MPKTTVFRSAGIAFPSAVLAMALTAVGVGVADPSPMIERSFHTAIAAGLSTPRTEESLISGTEAYWLGQTYRGGPSHEGRVVPASFSAPVTKGERIVVGSGAASRTLEVVSVEIIPPSSTRIDTGTAGRRLAVICRDPEAGDGHLVRFEVETQRAGLTLAEAL